MPEKKKISLGANKPMILDSHDRFWIIISGEVDLFFVDISDDGSYKSSLTFLYRAGKGDILFSLLTKSLKSGIKLLAVSGSATLLELSKNDLLDIDHAFLKHHIEKWIFSMVDRLNDESPPRTYHALDDGDTVSLNKDDIAYPSKGLLWCLVVQGDISKYANTVPHTSDSKYIYPIVVSNALWIKALSEDVHMEVLRTREVLKDEIYLMLALNELQDHLYEKLIENDQKRKIQERERITNKVKSDEKNLSVTLNRLGSIILNGSVKGKSMNTDPDIIQSDNNLMATCQLIGQTVGFKFEAPKFIDSYDQSTINQLYAIAQTSNVRVRKIILRGTWWKEENGHMLAFLKDDKRPVALIQKKPDTYVLRDVKDNIDKVVTKAIADAIDPVSYMFFYAFDKPMSTVKKIWEFAVKGVKKDAKYLILAALTGSLIGLLVPILSGVMFDDVIPAADKDLLLHVFAIMLIVGLTTALLQLIQGVMQLRVETKSNINLQAGLMDHLLRLPVSFYKKFSAGDLTHRALSVNTIRQILSNTVMTAVLSGAFSIVNLVLLFYYHSSLAWIGVALAVFAILFVSGIGWLKLKYDRHIADKQGDIQGFLFEFLSGITKIRVAGAEKRIFTLWANSFSKLKTLGVKSGSHQNAIELFNGSYPLLTNIFFFSFIYYTATTMAKGTSLITVGAFMAFISAFNQFLNDSLKMSLTLISSLNIVTLYERVKPILAEVPESSGHSNDPGELSGEIELNSVSFRYHEDQPLVLNNVSFKIKPGEMVAFVGPSGSGKSTVMRILLGFEEPESGSVYYDGHAFDAMNKDLVRRQIGVVLQNGALMAGSIYKNIVGNAELGLEDAWEAARMAGMEEDIKQMPMEMHTVISEGAGTFSGGQRQRLMIARAIVHKPRLLFMDEATSALDNRTQTIVSESLDRLQATRIVIAHRLSTVINADRIYVLDNGAIAEVGTYQELMEKEGLFSKLAKRQIAF